MCGQSGAAAFESRRNREVIRVQSISGAEVVGERYCKEGLMGSHSVVIRTKSQNI